MQLTRAARIILVGAPGVGKAILIAEIRADVERLTFTAGKGTQSDRLLKRFPQLSTISSGELLRENVRRKTTLGLEAQKLMNTGTLVPDTMMLQLIVAELTSHGWLKKPNRSSDATSGDYELTDAPSASFILDGFPRTVLQATQLDALVPVNFVVHIDTPTSIILDRIANRWVHAPSGRVYNSTFNPPKIPGKDDVTGELLTRREDDSPETWKTRLKNFEDASMPLLEHYENKGLLWRVQGNSSDEISPKLYHEFEQRFEAFET